MSQGCLQVKDELIQHSWLIQEYRIYLLVTATAGFSSLPIDSYQIHTRSMPDPMWVYLGKGLWRRPVSGC